MFFILIAVFFCNILGLVHSKMITTMRIEVLMAVSNRLLSNGMDDMCCSPVGYHCKETLPHLQSSLKIDVVRSPHHTTYIM